MLRRLLPLIVLLALAPAASAAAARRPAVGIGELRASMFTDARWKALHAPNVRVVVSWDVLWSPFELRELDDYMAAAGRAKANVLVTFAHSRVEGHEDDIPKPSTWRRLFNRFRAR
jgi:hypothetical protein